MKPFSQNELNNDPPIVNDWAFQWKTSFNQVSDKQKKDQFLNTN